MRKNFSRHTRARAGPVLCFLLLAATGCNDGESQRRERQELQEQIRKARQEQERMRQRREKDRRVLEARRKEAQSDASAALVIWAATAIALTVVIVLLARERHLRAIVERVVRLLLGDRQEPPP